ncbi:hypothetical protein KKG29_00555 [Patescibacteria group bacterium]|nr:hypothetical protein [Patescibacteria group bacterium]MBU3999658.1 hypothetical protein [Patescibacteria group bacterium]MBU4057173.1 hypothetical protein [Patescibacteria group bacterium]MBU4369003.1 hypothetical protein [Patescibacteria group bacterium]
MFKKAGLEKIKFNHKRKKTCQPDRRVSPSGLHQLADEMQIYFGGSFALYAKIIKTVGEQQAREWFSDSKTSKHPIKRFLYLYREFMRKIIWR